VWRQSVLDEHTLHAFTGCLIESLERIYLRSCCGERNFPSPFQWGKVLRVVSIMSTRRLQSPQFGGIGATSACVIGGESYQKFQRSMHNMSLIFDAGLLRNPERVTAIPR